MVRKRAALLIFAALLVAPLPAALPSAAAPPATQWGYSLWDLNVYGS